MSSSCFKPECLERCPEISAVQAEHEEIDILVANGSPDVSSNGRTHFDVEGRTLQLAIHCSKGPGEIPILPIIGIRITTCRSASK